MGGAARLVMEIRSVVAARLGLPQWCSRDSAAARLEALGEQLDGGNIVPRRIRADSRPLPGTRLIREHDDVQHVVTVRPDDFEYPEDLMRGRDGRIRVGLFKPRNPAADGLSERPFQPNGTPSTTLAENALR